MIVRWSPLAIDRVIEIGEWIASDHPAAAVRIADGFDAAERLEKFPFSGRRVPEFGERTDLREIFFEQFRIIYKVSETRVDILTVRHMLQVMDPDELGE